MEEKSCTIRMLDNASGEGGILYLINGKVMDARVGNFNGLEALRRIFFWNEVTVFLRQECAPRDNVINSDIQPIIMAALAAKDEAALNTYPRPHGSEIEKEEGQIDALRTLLVEKLGEQSGLGRIYQAEHMTTLQNCLNEVGQMSGAGAFKMGAITRNRGNNLVLFSSSPPIVLEIGPETAVEDILDVLKELP